MSDMCGPNASPFVARVSVHYSEGGGADVAGARTLARQGGNWQATRPNSLTISSLASKFLWQRQRSFINIVRAAKVALRKIRFSPSPPCRAPVGSFLVSVKGADDWDEGD